MNTDRGWVVPYTGSAVSSTMRNELSALLPSVPAQQFDGFVAKIEPHVSMYRAHRGVHKGVPTTKNMQRRLTKLKHKAERYQSSLSMTREGKRDALYCELLDLLTDAPVELMEQARLNGAPVDCGTLTSLYGYTMGAARLYMAGLIKAVDAVSSSYKKSKCMEEVSHVVEEIRTAFAEELGVTPVVRAFREKADIPPYLPVAEAFVPVLAEVLNVTIDRAYRLAT